MVVLMTGFWTTFSETWSDADSIFGILLVGAILVTLYAVALINRKLRLIESELQSIKKDQSVMSEELEIVASTREAAAE